MVHAGLWTTDKDNFRSPLLSNCCYNSMWATDSTIFFTATPHYVTANSETEKLLHTPRLEKEREERTDEGGRDHQN